MLLKRILLVNLFLLSFITMLEAQNKFNYTAAWKKVDNLIEKKGLTESALKDVQLIYNAAKKEKNNGQLLKAVLFRLSLQQMKEEDADIKSIAAIEKEISTAAEPLKSVLSNYAAEAYWQYFQNNRWKFYDRTNTVSFQKDDVSTWTIDELHKKISSLYLASLQNKKVLQQTKLDAYEPVINKGNARHLRPTLYDLLAHRAIDYFQNDERSITKPAEAFELNMAAAYDPAADFITRKFPTTDSLSLTQKALLLYQELIRFHLADKKADALMDVDLLRLQFVHRYSTHEDKTALYRMSLNHLLHQYNHQPIVSQAAYLLAKDYADYAATYDFKKHKTNDSLTPRYYYQKASTLCKQVLAQSTVTEGKANCANLLQQIESKSIAVTSEKVNVPGKPFRSLLQYRNTAKVWFRIVKIDQKTFDELERNRWEDTYWKKLTALQPSNSFSYNLPASEDHQQHSTEIKVNALPVGTYLLLASADEQFSLAKNVMAVQFFYVSNIAWMHNGNSFFVVNRESGQPLQKATVTLWEQSYNYDQRKNVAVKVDTYSTDANGHFLVTKAPGNNAYNRTIEVKYQTDQLHLDDRAYSYVYRGEKEPVDETKTRRTFFFTDRSIYRPGQTLYFKGIVTAKDATTGKPKTVVGLKTTITLYDANHQKVDSIKVSSSEYGSYSGKFILPVGRMTGNYYLQESVTGGSVYVSVEEYKRPKFFVEYQSIKQSFRVNDTIRITGNASAYAGNNIDGAKVKYRVVRQPRLLYPWLSWKWGWPIMQEQEITHGETTTKADGSFSISFAAIPDKQVRKELEPVFDYRIIADVTDLNGETRTGETTVTVGYTSLQLEIGLPNGELQTTNQFNSINISTKNMMGEFVKSMVTVSMYQLNAPDRLIRERYWEQPDQFIMNEKEYRAEFPHDEYNNERAKESWEKGKKVYEKKDSSSSNGQWTIDNKQLQPGWYLVEVTTTDKDGKEVKNQTYVQLTDEAGKLSSPEYVWQLPSTITAEPGTTATFGFGSSARDVYLIQVDPNNENKTPVYHQLNNEQKQLSIPVSEEQRGGFGYAYSFVKHNRFHSFTRYVAVPWTNKDLNITYETFRDKTLPGSEEQWKIKISGYKGDKVAAELLASMYDASLNQFKPHQWNKPDLFPVSYLRNNWNGGGFTTINTWEKRWEKESLISFEKEYDVLFTFNLEYSSPRHMKMMKNEAVALAAPAPMQDQALNEVVVTASGAPRTQTATDSAAFADDAPKPTVKNDNNTNIRTNFNETAFFFPDLKTDAEGNITFSFTMPEALTRWKAQLLAHTKDLSMGLSEQNIITQKDLMVQPFAPRFLREGDRFEFTAKISNMTDKEITGISNLQLLNTATMQPVDGWFQNTFPVQHFTVGAKQSTVVKFRTEIPYNFNEALTYRIIAKAGNQTDGEEATLPVLTNRMLVTESLPLNMRGDGTKTFNFTKLLNADRSESLTHHRFTIEFTSNPVWYAVQALPYLMEYPYECAEQTWNRFYANALASHITQKLPRIQQVMQQWKIKDTAALMSNLQKNEELKSALLQETPWVLQAKDEEQQKKNIALLFDMVRMNSELSKSLAQLQEMQSSNGGFVWFKGGPDDRYITQYIITGIGHLQKLNAVPKEQQAALQAMVAKAMIYLDKRLKEDYDNLLKYKTPLKNNNIGSTQIQYLYMRSFFPAIAQTKGTETAFNYYTAQAKQFWVKQSRYMQGMIALAQHRSKDSKTATAIVKSLKENALFNEEMGMYWKEFNAGYYWYQAPVEAQALMIEVFNDVTKDTKAVNDLKTWLLKQKQTQNWKTTIATAEACYALLLQGGEWIATEPVVEIKAGDQLFSTSTEKTEAGTGYFKRSIDGNFVKPSFGNITVTVEQSNKVPLKGDLGGPAWGAAYWQYFENLDKITSAETPLKLQKKYFVERNTANGPVLTPVEEGDELKVGDKIKVRIELRVDRNMEYVHMKDMRPSCMEPVNVLSQYKWQGGLGYYESTKDASTNFFFSWLNKGTYVFEYPLFITHAGNYSSGITTIQCMYAPEFTSHSEGVRVKVSE